MNADELNVHDIVAGLVSSVIEVAHCGFIGTREPQVSTGGTVRIHAERSDLSISRSEGLMPLSVTDDRHRVRFDFNAGPP